MPLAIGSTYENIFYNFVLDGLRGIFLTEFPTRKSYIAPIILHPDNFQIRLWGENATTAKWWPTGWQKEYNVNIVLYMIEKNPREEFYKQLYDDSERLYQLLHNNRTKSVIEGSTTFTWINGEVKDIVYNDSDENESEIDGLNMAQLSFSCLVERSE